MLCPNIKIEKGQLTEALKPKHKNLKTDKTILRSLRMPALTGQHWQTLSNSIQKRFMTNRPARQALLFKGRIHQTRLSNFGILVSKIGKILKVPLPQKNRMRGETHVIVREAETFNGQYWTRVQPSKTEMPQHSTTIKRFDGPTGLEENLTSYFGIALKIECKENTIEFYSDHFFFKIGSKRLKVPNFLAPGKLTISHKETGPKRFRYTFNLSHPLLGELIYQTIIFEEMS